MFSWNCVCVPVLTVLPLHMICNVQLDLELFVA
jgi:hypothetical protein